MTGGRRLWGRLALRVAACVALATGCGTAGHGVPAGASSSPPGASRTAPQGDSDAQDHRRGKKGPRPGTVLHGKASYYARIFVGRKTASGEIYRAGKMTAAHPTLPFGTWVRVTRLPNGPSVDVRINDRCGCGGGHLIDLSEAAARRLNMIRDGSVKVTVEVLGGRPVARADVPLGLGVDGTAARPARL